MNAIIKQLADDVEATEAHLIALCKRMYPAIMNPCPECQGSGEMEIFCSEAGKDYITCESCRGTGERGAA